MLLKSCICGCCAGDVQAGENGVEYIKCPRCGALRQHVEMTEEQYYQWYRDGYHESGGAHDHGFEHDYSVAQKRLKVYGNGFEKDMRILDVGSSNGAFVKACRDIGINAYGQEIVQGVDESGFCYEKSLFDIHFPVDFFDNVTMHDVFEHFVYPVKVMTEVLRFTKQGGKVWIDVPDFYSKNGKHHWREVQHLWMLKQEELISLMQDIGFVFYKKFKTIKGKFGLCFKKPEVKRTTVTLLPGIGDVYWGLTKLSAYTKENGIVDVYVGDLNIGRNRSEGFVRMFPFVNFAGYVKHDTKDAEWTEGYVKDGRTWFENKFGCDWLVSYNGILRWDKSLDDVDQHLPTEYFLPMFEDLDAKKWAERFHENTGDYIVGFFSSDGMFRKWTNEFSFQQISDSLISIAKKTGKKTVLVGAKWNEKDFNRFAAGRRSDGLIVDMTSKTTVSQVFALIRESDGMIGFPSGLTIMSVAMKKKTLIIWNKYFRERFWWTACAPQARDSWYTVLDSKGLLPEYLAGYFVDFLNNQQGVSKNPAKEFSELENPKDGKIGLPDKRPDSWRFKYNVSMVTPMEKPPRKRAYSLTVACVLKSGGDFTEDYVKKLKASVERHLSIPHRFVCLTDLEEIQGVDTIPLIHGWPGWWSKIELFRKGMFKGRVLFFDLDTVVIGPLSRLAQYPHKFSMLQGFVYRKNFASGVMAWEGDYSGIYERATRLLPDSMWSGVVGKSKLTMEQDFVLNQLKEQYKMLPDIVQNIISTASFKGHCSSGPPDGTKIVCFHGTPRPHEVNYDWVRRNWKV